MQNEEALNHRIAALGWGALFVWWGIVVMIDPITLGMGAIGTGLIFLGANLLRRLKGMPIRNSNTVVAVVAIVWGALDQVRTMLSLHWGLSFALLLIVIGLAIWFAPMLQGNQEAHAFHQNGDA